MKNRIPSYEWLIVIVFVSIVLVLSIVALTRTVRNEADEQSLPQQEKRNELTIKVEGEVAEPGVYYFPPKTTMKQLLTKVQLLPSADLSEFKGRKKLRDGQTVRFSKRHPIVIEIKGAVKEPGKKEILSGTRVHELVNELELLPNADVRRLEKQTHFLKEGEVVYVLEKGEKLKKRKKQVKIH